MVKGSTKRVDDSQVTIPTTEHRRVSVRVQRWFWIALMAIVGLLFLLPLDQATTDVVSDAGFTVQLVALVASLLVAAKRATGIDRTAWAAMAASLFLVLGLFLLFPGGPETGPNNALLGAPVVAAVLLATILLFGRHSLPRIGLASLLLDGTWLVSGLIVASWTWAFAPLPELSATTAERMILISFPMLAMLCSSITVSMLSRCAGSARLALASLGGGAATVGLAATIHTQKALNGTLVFGTPSDFLWTLGLGFIGLSTIDPSMGVRLRAANPSILNLQLITATPALLIVVPLIHDRWATTPVEGGFLMVTLLAVRLVVLNTANQNLNEQLIHRANRDELTGLLNRRALLHLLEQDQRQNDGQRSILYLDLDGFKDINDRFGHAAGDLVLQVVSDRLELHTRVTEAVARLGGDEFVVLTTGDASGLASRLQDAITHPIEWDGRQLRVDCCIGISDDYHLSPEERMAAADAALYRAKGRGRGGIEATNQPFSPHQIEVVRALARNAS